MLRYIYSFLYSSTETQKTALSKEISKFLKRIRQLWVEAQRELKEDEFHARRSIVDRIYMSLVERYVKYFVELEEDIEKKDMIECIESPTG